MKLAICNETFQNVPFEEACAIAGRCGYQGIELAPFTLGKLVTDISSEERLALRQAAENAGLEIVGLHWLLVLPPGIDARLHINCADEAVRRQTLEYYQELIRFCADLGGKIMVHGSPNQRHWEETDLYQHTFRHSVEFFKACMEPASGCGVTVCFEPLSHAETNFINTAHDALELIRSVDHPNFQLHLDAKAMCGGEYFSPATVIRQYADVMKHFHANDRNKRGPGSGDVDFKPILQALQEVEYRGYVSVEVFDYTPDGETIARESLAYLQSVLES